MRSIIPLVFSTAFFLAGLWMLYGGYTDYESTNRFKSTAIEVEGNVIRINAKQPLVTDASKSTTYHPVVRFQESTTSTIEFEEQSGSNPAAFAVGDSVSIIYQPNDPKNAKINTFWTLWLGTVVMGGMGFVFSSLGLAIAMSLIAKRLA